MKSNVQLRKQKRYKTIFKTIKANNNALSRADICTITKNSMTSVNESITALINDGMIFEKDSTEARVGRRPVFLSVNPSHMYFAGLECSSYSIDFVVIDALSRIIHKESLSLNYPKTQFILESIKKVISEYASKNPEIWDKLESITIALPGDIDVEKGIGISCNTIIADWKNVNVKQYVEQFTDKKLVFMHNTDSKLIGYLDCHKVSKKHKTAFMSFRNGIGIRIHSNGKLLSEYGLVCEFGHQKAKNSNRLCYCGKSGCYNTEVTIPATINKIQEMAIIQGIDRILEILSSGDEHRIISDFCDLVIENDKNAVMILSNMSDYISQIITHIVFMSRPDTIILATEFCKTGKIFEDMILSNLKQSCPELIPEIVYITTVNDYGSLGCALTGYSNYLDK